MEAAGLDRAALEAPEGLVAVDALFRIWSAAEAIAQRATLPLEAGLRAPYGAFGALVRARTGRRTRDHPVEAAAPALDDVGPLHARRGSERRCRLSATRSLGMSAGTLQRRLAEAGRTFAAVVEDFRRDEALRLVEATSTPFVEIAHRVGFAEQSSFNRAFRRWTGNTPREARAAAHPGGENR